MRASEVVGDEEVETGSRKTGSTNDVNEIVVCEVHCGPIKNSCISPNECRCMWEEMGEEEGLECSISRM